MPHVMLFVCASQSDDNDNGIQPLWVSPEQQQWWKEEVESNKEKRESKNEKKKKKSQTAISYL